MNKGKSSAFRHLLKEIVIITIGVCIGMMLNTWNQNRIEKTQAQQYLDGILQEVEHNASEVEKSFTHRKDLYEGLTNNKDVKLNLNPALLKKVAWELAQNNVFKENIDTELYLELAELYAIQERIDFSAEQASDRMSELNTIVPYYTLSTYRMNIPKKEIDKIESTFMRRWKPILKSWYGYEEKYLVRAEKILKKPILK